jgi:translation initiation factor IF-1
VGLLLDSRVSGAPLFVIAVAGGLAFEALLVRPFWNFLFRFESAPAQTLEHSIGDVARAATTFDASGNGLVTLELDGQVVQVLGCLRREDREAGVRVRAGDRVQIDDIDAERNRCTVRPLGV